MVESPALAGQAPHFVNATKRLVTRPPASGARGFEYGAKASAFPVTEQTEGGLAMPGNEHLKGVGPKEQRQYEHILESARKEGRYGGRAKEVAARTVLKEHRERGHPRANRTDVRLLSELLM
jgi:hypothetical protein